MKKLYAHLFTAVLVIFFGLTAFSQKITPEDALALVSENAPALHLTKEDVQNSIVTNAYFDKVSQLHLVYLQQSFHEVPVYNQIQVIAFKNGKPVSVKGGRMYRIEDNIADQKAVPSISSKEAVSAAAEAVNISADVVNANPLTILKTSPDNRVVTFAANAISRQKITSELMWVPAETGKVRLAWQVTLLPKNTPDYWLIRIDAKNAAVLGKDNLTVTCNWDVPINEPAYFEPLLLNLMPKSGSKPLKKNTTQHHLSPTAITSGMYRVIPFPAESMVHPGGTPVVVTNPWQLAGPGNDATTLQWHNDGTTDYNYTRGNNVLAWEDLDGDDDGTGNAPTSSTAFPNFTFDFTYDEHEPAGTGDNLYAAITNLFYWNNIIHDVTYQYGFDEPSGNFQNDNMGRGGAGSDFVVADAQDGSGTNNANFATGPDGINGHMQMYVWDSYRMGTFVIPAVGDFYAAEGKVSENNRLIDVGAVTGDVVLYIDDTTVVSNEACVPPSNAAALAGKIALIDRGNCDFTAKIKNAQDAGAIGVLIINNVPGQLIIMSGADNSITIPAVMILQGLGVSIKDILDNPGTIRVTLKDKGSLDGDFDNSIISHEYAHGISNRLTGGPATASCLQNAEQMGEGWSDYFALMLTTDWQTAGASDGATPRGIGTYVREEDPLTGSGIRTYPYSTDMGVNPWTYGDLASVGTESHTLGEIWAATLWDMTWNMIQIDGINTNLYNAAGAGGNSASLKLVMLGMKLQPCSPGFLDGRDALLMADDILYNGKYHCAIWDAFARRGMGVNAKQGSAYNTIDQVTDFDVPSGAPLKKTADVAVSPQNGAITYTFTVTAQCAGISNYTIVDTLSDNVTYVSGGTYNAGDRTVTFNIPSLAPMESQVFHLTVKVNEGTYFESSTQLSETIAGNFVPLTLTATSDNPSYQWDGTTTNHSPSFAVKSDVTSSPAEQILTSSASYLIEDHTQLSFWQNYNTQPGKDGGVVELSINGTDWFDAAPYMVQNGYNTTINTNSNLDGKEVFSGNSGGYIQTVINLSAFQGQQMFFRFRYVTDSAGLSLGWFIDDILITKSPAVYNIASVFNSGNELQSLSDTITAITNVVLPVSWGSFTASKEGTAARLNWTTEQESNTDKFFAQRSNDGVHFVNIGALDAAGNAATSTHYSYLDESPVSGVNFYRILQTDEDGRSNYSVIRSLNFDPYDGRIVLSPNPAKNDVILRIAGNQSLLTIKLIDASGRLLKMYQMKDEQLHIPLSAFTSGVYYLNISGKGMDAMKKLIKE